MPYMYILQCADGSYYTGSTWNLEKRLWEHQNGQGANHTAKHLPVKLIYCEECERIDDAYRREKQIQGWCRSKKEALMAGDANALHRLAMCRNDSRSTGFDSAQPANDSGQPTRRSSLSEAEGSEAEGSRSDEELSVEPRESHQPGVETQETESQEKTRTLEGRLK